MVAQLRPGVIARIRECTAGNAWCEVQVASHRGFVRRAELWGIAPNEERAYVLSSIEGDFPHDKTDFASHGSVCCGLRRGEQCSICSDRPT